MVRNTAKRPNSKRWLTHLLVLCSALLALIAFTLVPLTETSARLNSRQVFESSRWNALQLQLQSYRLMNYISDLSETDLPLNGNAYFQYDLVLSRIDLLRDGEIGNHIRSFSNGRATRLLNIISGELELISLNIKHLENGQLEQADIIMGRLRALDSQISDFVTIVNQGANNYMTLQREKLDQRLELLEDISIALVVVAALLAILAFRSSLDIRELIARNRHLDNTIKNLQKEKSDIITRIISELKPNIITITGWSSSALQLDTAKQRDDHLERISDLSGQVLTQIDSYHDLVLLETGELTIQNSDGDLKSNIEHSILSMRQQLLTHNVRLLCLFDPRLPRWLEADFKRLHEIMVTLLSQLTLYCPNSAMLIQIRPSTLPLLESNSSRFAKEMRMIQISIKDYGNGLPEDIQSGLRSNPYNPGNNVFGQVHKMGVGFTFCQYLITELGGELHFSSSAGSGTEMWVDLPMRPLHESKRASRLTASDQIGVLESQHATDDMLLVSLNGDLQTLHFIAKDAHIERDVAYFAKYKALILPDITTLDSTIVQTLMEARTQGVKLFATHEAQAKYPILELDGTLQMPVTESQLEKLIYPGGQIWL